MRQTWDEYFLTMAEHAATRSTCNRLHVGCVMVRNKIVLATGYNGSPSGMPHCDDVGHLMINGHCERTIHAEKNAIAQAARNGVRLKGATCYITHTPCYSCGKTLHAAGIDSIIVKNKYGDDENLSRLYIKINDSVYIRREDGEVTRTTCCRNGCKD